MRTLRRMENYILLGKSKKENRRTPSSECTRGFGWTLWGNGPEETGERGEIPDKRMSCWRKAKFKNEKTTNSVRARDSRNR